MKSSILSFILVLGLSYEVSAQSGYQDAPPPQYDKRYDKRYGNGSGSAPVGQAGMLSGFDYNNRYFKFSLGSASISSNEFFGSDIEYKDSSALPLTLGMGIESGLVATEVELFFAGNDVSRIDGSSDPFPNNDLGVVSAFGVNANILFRGFLSPVTYLYAGGGLGTIAVNVRNGNFDNSSGSTFSIQGIVGGEFRPTQKIGLFAEYKLLSSLGLRLENDDFFSSEDSFHYVNSSLNVGLKVYY